MGKVLYHLGLGVAMSGLDAWLARRMIEPLVNGSIAICPERLYQALSERTVMRVQRGEWMPYESLVEHGSERKWML